MALLIGSGLFAIAAPFVLYPIILWIRAALAPNPIAAADCTPTVSLIICAHNEEGSLPAKLENALALDYPSDRLQICLASDGSTDATVDIAKQFEKRGVRVLDLPRNGKAYALSAAANSCETDVLAFSDANSQWQPDALRALVRPFADPRVGGVAGDQRYAQGPEQGRTIDDTLGERTYWNFDRQLKQWQSSAGNVISATGAIYAVRRSLFQSPPADATDDFMISTGVIAQGQRLVFAADAVSIEPPAGKQGSEFRRKVRVITRGLRGVGYRKNLLNPTLTGVYAFELLLHKLWRRLTWIPFLMLLLSTPFAWSQGGYSAAFSIGLVTATAVGVAGLVVPGLGRLKLVALASYILMVNGACAFASLNALRGRRVSHWDPERTVGDVSRPAR